jgi:site-specific DNA-cytosine methylase
MRIVNILNPTWILIENVPRLLSINEGKDFATVLQTLSESGYGYSWRVLDSQYFGVAQRRKRVFIVGCFGRECPPEILFEQKSSSGNDKKKQKMGQRGLCISTKCGERQAPTSDTIIASTIRGQDCPQVGNKNKVKHNFIASTLGQSQNPDPNYGTHFVAEKVNDLTAKSYGDKGWSLRNEWNTIVAQTLGATPRGNTSFIWQDTHIAEINPDGKRKIARISKGLDSRRGIVIGNAVTVNVAEWIAKRIMERLYETI